MLPFVQVFNHSINMYWLSEAVGVLLACGLTFLRVRSGRFQTSGKDMFFIWLLIIVGAWTGATLFQFVGHAVLRGSNPAFWTVQNLLSFLRSGGVFYGAMVGGVLAMTIYIRKRKLDFRDTTDILVPCFLLYYAFNRLGCFFAGCCFGREAAWGIPRFPGGVPLIPVQLISVVFILIVLAEMLIFCPERKRPGVLLPIYLIIYAIGRFLIEFMRGDVSRGVFIFSTSQWISLAILLTLGVVFMIRRRKRQDKTNEIPKESLSLEGNACENKPQ